MVKKPKIFIFILSYNHQKTIMILLDRISRSTWNAASEILIADDCSSDDTIKMAEKYKKDNKLKKLTIISHKKNKGYGGNQKFCYSYAMKKGYDIAVMLHGDLQYPPEYIVPLANTLIKEKAAMVFGSRMTGHPLMGGMPLYKFFGNIFLTGIENLVLRTRLSEFHSGFRLYSIKVLREMPLDKLSDDFHFDSEIIIQFLINKKKIVERPIPTFYGDEKCNVNVFKYGLNILKILGQYILHQANLRNYDKFIPSHKHKA